jgi:hypothetical protein
MYLLCEQNKRKETYDDSNFEHHIHSWFSEELSGNETLNQNCAEKVEELEAILKVL